MFFIIVFFRNSDFWCFFFFCFVCFFGGGATQTDCNEILEISAMEIEFDYKMNCDSWDSWDLRSVSYTHPDTRPRSPPWHPEFPPTSTSQESQEYITATKVFLSVSRFFVVFLSFSRFFQGFSMFSFFSLGFSNFCPAFCLRCPPKKLYIYIYKYISPQNMEISKKVKNKYNLWDGSQGSPGSIWGIRYFYLLPFASSPQSVTDPSHGIPNKLS